MPPSVNCKTHGLTEDTYCVGHKYYYCAICMRARSKTYRASAKGQSIIASYKHTEEFKNYKREYNRTYFKTETGKSIQKKMFQKRRDNLHDDYIKRLLINRTQLKASDLPRDLIDVKRLQVVLIRKLNKVKQNG